jgi:hypothetical protein
VLPNVSVYQLQIRLFFYCLREFDCVFYVGEQSDFSRNAHVAWQVSPKRRQNVPDDFCFLE